MEELKAQEIVSEILEGQDDLFLVDLKLKGAKGNQKLLVFIDGDEGVSIDQCSKVSRELGAKLEELEVFEEKYTLEVSSPGLDFPLTNNRQYKKNIGRDLDVEIVSGEKIEGTLKSTSKEGIVLENSKGKREVSWDEIEKTKIKISFK